MLYKPEGLRSNLMSCEFFFLLSCVFFMADVLNSLEG